MKRFSVLSSNALPQSGAAIVEFIIKFPFILLLIFTTLEFTNWLRVHQEINAITKDAASLAVRECTRYVDNGHTSYSNCLSSTRVKGAIKSLISNSTALGANFPIAMRVAMWKHNPAGATPEAQTVEAGHTCALIHTHTYLTTDTNWETNCHPASDPNPSSQPNPRSRFDDNIPSYQVYVQNKLLTTVVESYAAYEAITPVGVFLNWVGVLREGRSYYALIA